MYHLNWLSKVLFDKSPQMIQLRSETWHIRRIATKLANLVNVDDTSEFIIQQCREVLNVDTACVYLLEQDGYFRMVAEHGCLEEFKIQWNRIPADWLPLLETDTPHEAIFFGTSEELKLVMPQIQHLIEQADRHTVVYAPLVVNSVAIGVLGFGYDEAPEVPPEREFIITLVNLFAQALERGRLLENERLARLAAEDANKAKTHFLANISHEIRTPIAAIQGFAHLIHQAANADSEQKQWAERILKNGRYLTGLIGDVLDISKIEAESVEVRRHFFSIAELIEDVKSATGFKAEEKRITLNFIVSEPNIYVQTDPIHLRQILINLIGNAIKFTYQGLIEIRFEFLDSKMRIRVTDTGIGISAEDQERIFKPFVQGDNANARFGGSGLGLSISKHLCSVLGGELTLVKSGLGQGSIFSIELKCEISRRKVDEAKTSSASPNLVLEGLNVLLVEDSIDNRYLLSHALSSEGAKVDVAENGRAGIDKAMAQEFDLVIMDIQMPVLDGNEAILELRSKGYKKPVLALTACALTSEREKAYVCGFDDYLTKPIDFTRLVQTVRRLIPTGNDLLH